MAAMTSRRVARLAVMVALAALAGSGCGGGAKTNGLGKKSATQVQQDAIAALKAARSVHVIGTSRNQGKPVGLDLRIQGGSRAGTMELDGAQFEITTLGADTYLKAEQRAWKALGAPPAVAGCAGRWVKLRSRQLNLEGISLDSLAAQLSKNDSPSSRGSSRRSWTATGSSSSAGRTAPSSTSPTPALPTRFAWTTRARTPDKWTSPSTAPISISPHRPTPSATP